MLYYLRFILLVVSDKQFELAQAKILVCSVKYNDPEVVYITLPYAYSSGIMEIRISLSIPLFRAMCVPYHYLCSWFYKGVM